MRGNKICENRGHLDKNRKHFMSDTKKTTAILKTIKIQKFAFREIK